MLGGDGNESVRYFGTSADMSGHFGTSAEMSWVRSVLGPKCLDTLAVADKLASFRQ